MDWHAFLSTFGLVFVAELGDKTQLAVMTQVCKFRRPWPVFVGGSLALTGVTALGALGGQIINAFIPTEAVQMLAALAFVVMGILIWREAAPSDEQAVCTLDDASTVDNKHRWDWKAFSTTLSLLFVAELGDKTQLAVLGLASKQPNPWLIFAGGATALTLVTALGVVGGQQLGKWIPEHVLLKISAGMFVILGVFIGLGIV